MKLLKHLMKKKKKSSDDDDARCKGRTDCGYYDSGDCTDVKSDPKKNTTGDIGAPDSGRSVSSKRGRPENISSSSVIPKPVATEINNDTALSTNDENDQNHCKAICRLSPGNRLGGNRSSGNCQQKEETWRNNIVLEADALDKSGNQLFEKGQYDEAFVQYERALLLKRSLQANKNDGGDDADAIADQAVEDVLSHNSRSSEDNQKQSEITSTVQKKETLASVATSINNITYVKQRAGEVNVDETMLSYFKALQIKREVLGPDHLSIGKTLNNIGSVFYLKREYGAALKAYMEALRIMQARLGKEHQDVGTVFSNIADAHLAAGRNREALEKYREALNVRWADFDINDFKVTRLVRQIAILEVGDMSLSRNAGESEYFSDDSDGSRYQKEGRWRYGALHKELRVLHDEIDDDIQFINAVEQQVSADMTRDKTHILREIHSFFAHSEEDGTANSGLSEWNLSAVMKPECSNESALSPELLSPLTFLMEESPARAKTRERVEITDVPATPSLPRPAIEPSMQLEADLKDKPARPRVLPSPTSVVQVVSTGSPTQTESKNESASADADALPVIVVKSATAGHVPFPGVEERKETAPSTKCSRRLSHNERLSALSSVKERLAFGASVRMQDSTARR